MKKSLNNEVLTVLVIFLLVSQVGFFFFLKDKHISDKYEWLVDRVISDIELTTKSWEKRYNITPIIYREEKIISVGVSEANGEKTTETFEHASLIHSLVKARVEAIIANTRWLKGHKVSVTIHGEKMWHDSGDGVLK